MPKKNQHDGPQPARGVTPNAVRRVTPNVIALVVIAAVVAVVLLVQQPWASAPSAKALASGSVSGTLAAQIRNLQSASVPGEFVAAAGDSDSARRWATTAWENLELLGATDLSLRFVSGGDPGVHSGGAVEAETEVSWRPGAGSGLAATQTEGATVTLIFDKVGDKAYAVREAKQSRGPLPVWLVGALAIDEVDGAQVIAIDGGNDSATLATYAARAYKDVNTVVPGANSTLVIIAPKNERQAAALLGEPVDTITQLAAVTTTVDGSSEPKAATAIVLNPAVFSTMDARAAQVVVTHEATHQMTGATAQGLENWVAEGFADFVALKDDSAPLSVSAGQILAQVKKSGAPKALPTRDDFDSAEHGLGATYEAAWMVFRMLGERFDDATIVDFYRETLDGAPVAESVQKFFGLTLDKLAADWRDYLLKSVSTSS